MSMRNKRAVNDTLWNTAQLSKLAARAGSHHRIEGNTADEIVSGNFNLTHFASGVTLHIFDGLELETSSVSIDLPPGLTLCLLLKGNLTFSLDQETHFIRNKSETSISAFAFNLTQSCTLHREVRSGKHTCKINISLSREWIDKKIRSDRGLSPKLQEFMTQHKSVHSWAVDENCLQLAQHILNTPPEEHFETTLLLEGLTLALASSLIQGLTHSNNKKGTVYNTAASHRHFVKATEIREKVDQFIHNEHSPNTRIALHDIADELGMSTSNMQRLFKKAYQQTIAEYARLKKLERARHALLHQGATIGEAAYIAGYRHTPNFAIAFKRTFGIAPGAIDKAL